MEKNKILNISNFLSDEEKESFRAKVELIKKLQNNECDIFIITETELKEIIPDLELFKYKSDEGLELIWRV